MRAQVSDADESDELALSAEAVAQAVDAGGLGAWRWDVRTHLRSASPHAAALLQTTIGGRAPNPLPLETVHLKDRKELRAWFAELLQTPGQRGELDVRIMRPDGDVSWVAIAATALPGPSGAPLALSGTIADVTLRRQVQADLEHQALHDPLTGLPNRVLLHDRLQQLVLAAERNGTHGALLILDLDRFKDLNDTLGHEAGDVVLQEVSEMLASALRASDTVARMGGDEFAVLLPGADEAGAGQVASKLLARIRHPFVMDGLPVEGTAGLVVFPQHGTEAATLLRRAEIALYTAKRSGVQLRVYAPEDDCHSPERLTQAADLRRAIERGDLLVQYQPKVDCSTGQPIGVEALVRWQHGRRLVPPDEFIPLAEQNGLIGALTQVVLDRSMRQCVAWRELGMDLSVAVNLSARELHDPSLPSTVSALLQASGLAPGHLILEITESSLLVEPERALAALHQLRAMGVELAIDDFGTGYSSLTYLKRLPVGQLKIDRSFIRHITGDPTDRAIVRSTIDLAHSLGLEVVAEGVEDGDSLALLGQLACDQIQGYYYSRPLAAPEITTWLLGHFDA